MASRAYRPAEAARSEQRAEPRFQVVVTRAAVRKAPEQPAEALLHDVSIYGCRVESASAFDAGERVWIRLAGSMPVAAQIMWRNQRLLGCRFDEPIERRLLRSLTIAAV